MDGDNQNRIDAYIRGEMTPSERIAFEEELRSDPQLQKEYHLTKAIAQTLAQRQDKLKAMRRWDMEEGIEKAQRKKTKKAWSIGISAAACLVVGFFAIQSIFINHPISELDEEVSPAYFPTPSYRSSNSIISLIDSLIEIENYKEANRLCDSLRKEYSATLDSLHALEDPNPRTNYQILLTEYELGEVESLQSEISEIEEYNKTHNP